MRTLAIPTILAALAACSPYDPSLPHKPFLCSDQAPSCPDGFVCITDGDRRVCSDEPAPDAGVADALPAQISTLAL